MLGLRGTTGLFTPLGVRPFERSAARSEPEIVLVLQVEPELCR